MVFQVLESYNFSLLHFLHFSMYPLCWGTSSLCFTVISEPALHSPTYFLLSNLSLIDVCLSTPATCKMTIDFLMEHKTISFDGCMTQILFLHVFAGGEMMLLVAMAYDRYVAICRPLYYVSTMSLRKCTSLVVGSWLIGVLHSLSQLVFIVNLPFCGPNKVDSYYCDLPLVIKLACTNTFTLEVLMLSDSGLMATSSFVLLLISYTLILVIVRRRPSAGMAKARATLTAHIIVVTLFFGSCIFIYAWPFSSLPVDKVLSIFYTVFNPLLNPMIYALRNKEVISAMQKLRSQQVCF